MGKTSKVIRNNQGGHYSNGKHLDKAKWVSIVDTYLKETEDYGKCTISRLMDLAKIGRKNAMKALCYHDVGTIIPSR